ncbi:MAG: Integral membrane protein, partial [uncultured Friedmanniella sp.]
DGDAHPLAGAGARRRPADPGRQGRARPQPVRPSLPLPPDRGGRHLGGGRDAARPVVRHRAGRPHLLRPDLRLGSDLGGRQLPLRAAAPGPHPDPRCTTTAGDHAHPGGAGAGRGVRRWRADHPRDPRAGRPHRERPGLRPGRQPLPAAGNHPGQRDRRRAVLPGRPVRGHRQEAAGADLHGDLLAGHRGGRQPAAGLRRRRPRRGGRAAAARRGRRAGTHPDPHHLVDGHAAGAAADLLRRL